MVTQTDLAPLLKLALDGSLDSTEDGAFLDGRKRRKD